MRYFWRGLCTLALLVTVAMAMPKPIVGQTPDGSGEAVASLKDQLEKGLRARRAVEIQFVRRVAQLVDQGRLSKEFVQGTFTYTVKRYGKKKSLVPYFEQVLRHRAARDENTALNNVPTTLLNAE